MLTQDSLLLTVRTGDKMELLNVVRAANAEAACLTPQGGASLYSEASRGNTGDALWYKALTSNKE